MAYLLGLDIGTSGVKALLLRTDGTVAATAISKEYPLYAPRPQWAEQVPEDWWEATKEVLQAVLAKAGAKGEEVAAIGLSGQMHGSVFLNEKDEVIRPALLWCDQRTGPQCEVITAKLGQETILEELSNPVLTGFTAPKILWLKDNEPANFERVRKILLPKDYIRLKLTGEYATEVSDASGTALFNVRKRQWSQVVLDKLELDRELLPAVYESPEVSGHVSKSVVSETGLKAGTPVVGGGGDQAAGAVGNGIVEPGIVSSTLGTSGVVFAFADEPFLDPELRVHTFCHAVPGKWHVMGVILSAGGAFRWLRDALCSEEKSLAERSGRDPYEYMNEQAAQAPAGSEGLLFLPYLAGERTPYPDPEARGVFSGLTLRHSKPHLMRAVMEGVAFGLRDSFEILKEMGVPVKRVRASGGGARSELWLKIQASVTGYTHNLVNVDEGGSLGVALLAGVGTGVWDSVEAACKAVVQETEGQAPDPEWQARYEALYPYYRRLYSQLKQEFKGLSNLVNQWAD